MPVTIAQPSIWLCATQMVRTHAPTHARTHARTPLRHMHLQHASEWAMMALSPSDTRGNCRGPLSLRCVFGYCRGWR